MESISKSIIQGVWDPTHSTRVGITSGCRHYTRLPFITPGCCHYIRLPPLSTRMSTSGILLSPPFHLDVHIQNSAVAAITPGCFASGILTPDGRGERFNFHDQTYPDPPKTLTRRISQQFCTVPRCSPEASQYVRQTSLDIFL